MGQARFDDGDATDALTASASSMAERHECVATASRDLVKGFPTPSLGRA
jgi:hypothetical protein